MLSETKHPEVLDPSVITFPQDDKFVILTLSETKGKNPEITYEY